MDLKLLSQAEAKRSLGRHEGKTLVFTDCIFCPIGEFSGDGEYGCMRLVIKEFKVKTGEEPVPIESVINFLMAMEDWCKRTYSNDKNVITYENDKCEVK